MVGFLERSFGRCFLLPLDTIAITFGLSGGRDAYYILELYEAPSGAVFPSLRAERGLTPREPLSIN